MNSIHDAIEARDFLAVKALLEVDPQNRDSKDGLGNYPLHAAASTGQTDVVRLLLDLGANVNARGDLKRTPLHYAAKENELDVVRLLIDRGAELAPVDDSKITPLFYAVQGTLSVPEVARILLSNGAPVDLSSAVWLFDASGLQQRFEAEPDAVKHAAGSEYLLTQAVIKGDPASVDVLLRHGVPINGWEGARPLSCALPRLDILKQLLEAGADVTVKDASGETALQKATLYGSTKAIQLLREFGA